MSKKETAAKKATAKKAALKRSIEDLTSLRNASTGIFKVTDFNPKKLPTENQSSGDDAPAPEGQATTSADKNQNSED
mgnify:CR=1 FL=1